LSTREKFKKLSIMAGLARVVDPDSMTMLIQFGILDPDPGVGKRRK
jgi:hypothetical protein